MNTISATRFQILPAKDGTAWLDADKSNSIDDSDSYLTLHGDKVAFSDLKPADFNVVNGPMNFVDSISVYRCKQSLQNEDGKLFLEIAEDSSAPYEKVEGGEVQSKSFSANGSEIQLIKGDDGVLRWNAIAPPPPPPDPDALTEAKCVQRDGILHWVFPGEHLEPGDVVVNMG